MCKHCIVSATKNGEDMSMDTFTKVVEFIDKIKPKVVIISGGEPTDHHDFREFINYLYKRYSGVIVVTTHGKWLFEKGPNYAEYFKRHRRLSFQVTNDDRYYPVKFSKKKAALIQDDYPNVIFCWRIGGEIYPQGRAVKYMKVTHENTGCKATKCFNLRSMCNNAMFPTLRKAIDHLESLGKFCTPSIHIDGSVKMGESNECPSIAHCTDSRESIHEAIKTSDCNDCKMLTNLSPMYLNAIGMFKP